MASQAISGRIGEIFVGTDKIGEIREWSLSVEREMIDVTSKDSAGWTEGIPGNASWSVSAEALYLDPDAAQDAVFSALDGETSVTLSLRPEGTALGEREFTGTAHVTSWELSSPQDDAHAVSLEFEGSGALTKGMQA